MRENGFHIKEDKCGCVMKNHYNKMNCKFIMGWKSENLWL